MIIIESDVTSGIESSRVEIPASSRNSIAAAANLFGTSPQETHQFILDKGLVHACQLDFQGPCMHFFMKRVKLT